MTEAMFRPEHVPALNAYPATIGYGVLKLAFDLQGWPPPDTAPKRCALCGERHRVCNTHGDMGCDCAVANWECKLCRGELAARRGEVEP